MMVALNAFQGVNAMSGTFDVLVDTFAKQATQ